jgi:cytochrome c553
MPRTGRRGRNGGGPASDHVDPTAPRWGELLRTTPFERGRYTASVTCSECHGVDFKGLAYFPSPSLAIVNGYYLEQFRRLLRTGEHLNGRTDGMMADLARAAFTEFTHQEIDDLYAFLTGTFADAGLPAGR